jgi:hypothetical protein
MPSAILKGELYLYLEKECNSERIADSLGVENVFFPKTK